MTGRLEWIGRGDPGEVVPDVYTFANGNVSEQVQKVIPESRSPSILSRIPGGHKPVRRARLFIAGLGLYELRLNGEKVGQHVLSPSKTIFRKRILYDTYDITSELNQGVSMPWGSCWVMAGSTGRKNIGLADAFGRTVRRVQSFSWISNTLTAANHVWKPTATGNPPLDGYL